MDLKMFLLFYIFPVSVFLNSTGGICTRGLQEIYKCPSTKTNTVYHWYDLDLHFWSISITALFGRVGQIRIRYPWTRHILLAPCCLSRKKKESAQCIKTLIRVSPSHSPFRSPYPPNSLCYLFSLLSPSCCTARALSFFGRGEVWWVATLGKCLTGLVFPVFRSFLLL